MLVRRGILWSGVAVAAAAIAFAGCSGSDDGEKPVVEALCSAVERGDSAPHPGFVVLDTSGRLTRFSVPAGRPVASRRFADPEIPGGGIGDVEFGPALGRLLAPVAGGTGIAMLERKGSSARDEVLLLDSASLRPRCRFGLPAGIRYRAVSATPERVVAIGNRPEAEKRSASVYTVIDSSSERPRTYVLRPANDDWFVQWGAATADMGHLIVSYHGGASGADLVALADDGSPEGRPRFNGFVHGAAEPDGDGFIATTGSDLIRLDAASGKGDQLDPKAGFVHLMQFAAGAEGRSVYIGSCGGETSVNGLNVETGKLRQVPAGDACGDVLAVAEDRYVAFAPIAGDGSFSSVRLIALEKGGPGIELSGLPPQAVMADPPSDG
jgi:hypothetical protein